LAASTLYVNILLVHSVAYTTAKVIKTKAPVTCQEYGDNYCLIEAIEPTDPYLKETLESMKARGVKFLYGRWLIEGGPKVLLFDTGSCMNRLDEWKADLWSLAGIPTPNNDQETNETVIFGYLVAWFLGEVSFLTPENVRC
jgi:glycogen(starch) synthase